MTRAERSHTERELAQRLARTAADNTEVMA
jgi:hypothetical protein